MRATARNRIAASAVLAGALAVSPAAHAANCTTGAKAAADLWKEYDKIAKQIGCVGVTAGAAAATGGASLPQSAEIYKQCFEAADKADEASRKMIAAWNDMNKNGWGTIGPRDMEIGKTYEGTIPSQGTRMFIKPAPMTSDFAHVSITKRKEGWNKAATRVTVCKFPPGGPGVGVKGEELWSFTVAKGRKNQGKTWERTFAGLKGHILTVAFKGKSAAKQMKYRVSLPLVLTGPTVLIRSDDVPGSTTYTVEATDSLSKLGGSVLGHDVSVDSDDAVQGNRALGKVGRGNDAYMTFGSVKSVLLDKPKNAMVYIDGELLIDRAGADHRVVIDGGAASGQTDYTIVAGRGLRQVDGTLDGIDVSIDSNDSVAATTARGGVTNGADGFLIKGKVKKIELSNPGAADIYVDGKLQGGEKKTAAAPKVTVPPASGMVSVPSGPDQAGAQDQSSSQESAATGDSGSAGTPALDPGLAQVPDLTPDPGALPAGGSGEAPDAADPNLYQGRWSSNFGELRLHRVDDYLIGDYADNGLILGRVSGRCVAGVFTNGERNGNFRFRMTGDGRFAGQWAWHGNALGGEWKGERTGDAPAQLANFTRTDSATARTVEQNRSVFDGRYKSDRGPLSLYSRDLFLIGDYGDDEILAGIWDGDGFVGRFTEDGQTGWFDLRFFSRNGEFRDGEWGWVGEEKAGDWQLSPISGQTPRPDGMIRDVSCGS